VKPTSDQAPLNSPLLPIEEVFREASDFTKSSGSPAAKALPLAVKGKLADLKSKPLFFGGFLGEAYTGNLWLAIGTAGKLFHPLGLKTLDKDSFHCLDCFPAFGSLYFAESYSRPNLFELRRIRRICEFVRVAHCAIRNRLPKTRRPPRRLPKRLKAAAPRSPKGFRPIAAKGL